MVARHSCVLSLRFDLRAKGPLVIDRYEVPGGISLRGGDEIGQGSEAPWFLERQWNELHPGDPASKAPLSGSLHQS